MDENTLEEIDKLAKSMADQGLTHEEDLFDTIKAAGKENMQKALETMDAPQKELIKSVLEKYSEPVEEVPSEDEELIFKAIEHEDIDEEEMDVIFKSLNHDADSIIDYFNTDVDAFAASLLLNKAKTSTRGGVKYYADGPNAGKIVGSIRGDGASARSIARARRKGKISSAGAKQGIKQANENKREDKGYEKVKEQGGARGKLGTGGADMNAIKRRAARQLARQKEGSNSDKAQARTKKIDAENKGKTASEKAPLHAANSKESAENSRKKFKDLKSKQDKRDSFKVGPDADKARSANERGANKHAADKYWKDAKKRDSRSSVGKQEESPEYQAKKKKLYDSLKVKKSESEDIMENDELEKAIKMDSVAHPEADAMSEKVMPGKVDQKKEQDEEDEKMVSSAKEAAEVRHQGGSGDDGAWQGQVIKSEQKEFIKETLILAKSMGIPQDKLKEAIVLSKGNMALVRAILEKSKEGACARMDSEMKKKAAKKKPESGEACETADEEMKKVPSEVKKSVFWGAENDLIKASTKRGQNAHYEVQDELIKAEEDQAKKLGESTFNYEHDEIVSKARGSKTINEMIAKGEDQSECSVIAKSRKQDPSGAYTVTSFDVMQIAKDMGISEEDANELLGLKKSGEMEPIYDDASQSDAEDMKGEKLEKKPKKKKEKEKKMPDVK